MTEPISLSRRRLIQGVAAAAAGTVPLVAYAQSHVFAQGGISSSPFTLGIASGDPAPDGFVIWTRLAFEPFDGGGMGADPIGVRYEVATDESFRSIVRQGQVEARASVAHSVHVELEGLEPDRIYHYRFFALGIASPAGRARTFPAPGADVTKIRFATAGCQRWEHGFYTAFRHLAEEAPDFVYHYGDYIYEFGLIKTPPPNRVIVRNLPRDIRKAKRLSDYRLRYAIYKSDPDLQAAHEAAAFIPTFDDHEVKDGWGGDTPDNRFAATADPGFLKRRAAAFQAWYEHMPVRIAQRPRGSSMLANRRLRLGRLATLHVLDTRQHRTGQRCGSPWSVCDHAGDSDLSILGEAQERWLYNGLRVRDTRWDVLAQQVFMMQLDRSAAPDVFEINTDLWDGYAANRQRLLDAAREAAVPGLVTLTGDIHSNWAGDLKQDFNNERSTTVGVEFAATSISSSGDGVDYKDGISKLSSLNPHVKFHNRQRGYVMHTISTDHWRADFRVLAKVTVPGQPVTTRRSLVSEWGRPGIEEA